MSLCNTNQSLFKLRNENSRLLEQLECNDALLVNKKKNLQQLCRSPEESINLRTEESVLTWKERSESWRSCYCGVPSLSRNDHFCKLSNHALRSVLVNSSLKLRKPLSNFSGLTSTVLNSKFKLVEDALSGKVRTPRKGFVVKPGSIYPAVMAEKGKILAKRKDKKSSQQRRLKSNVKSGRPSARSKNKPEKKQKPPSESEKEVEHNKEDVPVPKEEVADPSTPDICSKCLDEARHLLNYSPKSLFLRRMKQRLARFEKKTDKIKLSSDLSESKNESTDTCSECTSGAHNYSSSHTCSKAENSIKAQICPNKLKSSQTLLGLNTLSSSNCLKCLRRHCLCARTFSHAYSNSPNLPDARKYHITQNSSNIRNASDMVNGCNAPNCSKAQNSSNSPNFPKVPNCCNKATCPKALNYVDVLNTLKALRALKSPKEQIRENINRVQCCRHGESSQAHHPERPRSEPRTSDDFCEKKAYKSESNCREVLKMKQEHHRASQKRCFSQPTFRNTCMKSNPSLKNHDVHTKKNSSRKIIRTRSNATQVSGKCSCKKESGGRCCCERDDPNPDLVCKLPCCTQEISVQVPEVLEISVQASGEGTEVLEEVASGGGEVRRAPSGGCGGGGRQRSSVSVSTTTEPSLQHYEALCHFRQKHWFDCHAHPHGVPDLPDTKMQVAAACSPEADILGPLEDPCFRLYCLNKRLFPEVFSETHGAGCCVTAQNACSPPSLLPNQRRLITLPALTPQYSLQNGNTMKLPCGVRFFPSSNVLVCDPKTLAAPLPPPTLPQPPPPPTPPPPQTAPSSPSKPRRMHIPVPTNSLALRFQKGVV